MLALKRQREVEHRLAAVVGTASAYRYWVTVLRCPWGDRLTLLQYKLHDKIAVAKSPMPDRQQRGILHAFKISLPSRSIVISPTSSFVPSGLQTKG